MSIRELYSKYRNQLLIFLLAVSAIQILYLLFVEENSSELLGRFGLAAAVVAFGEVLFILGLGLIVGSKGSMVLKNIRKVKLREALQNLDRRTTTFWLGLVVNTLGALIGVAAITTVIVLYLPVASWWLLWIPAVDLLITVMVRATIVVR